MSTLLLDFSLLRHGSLGCHGPQKVGFVDNCHVDVDKNGQPHWMGETQ